MNVRKLEATHMAKPSTGQSGAADSPAEPSVIMRLMDM